MRGGDGASQREQGGGGPDVACEQQTHFRSSLLSLLGGESIFLSRVEGSMSRARVPCRGSRVTFFFSNFLFLEKVIIDAINVIKKNKKNLKNKWRVNIF